MKAPRALTARLVLKLGGVRVGRKFGGTRTIAGLSPDRSVFLRQESINVKHHIWFLFVSRGVIFK